MRYPNGMSFNGLRQFNNMSWRPQSMPAQSSFGMPQVMRPQQAAASPQMPQLPPSALRQMPQQAQPQLPTQANPNAMAYGLSGMMPPQAQAQQPTTMGAPTPPPQAPITNPYTNKPENHMLAYITPNEASQLQSVGGGIAPQSGRQVRGPGGIPAFPAPPGRDSGIGREGLGESRDWGGGERGGGTGDKNASGLTSAQRAALSDMGGYISGAPQNSAMTGQGTYRGADTDYGQLGQNMANMGFDPREAYSRARELGLISGIDAVAMNASVKGANLLGGILGLDVAAAIDPTTGKLGHYGGWNPGKAIGKMTGGVAGQLLGGVLGKQLGLTVDLGMGSALGWDPTYAEGEAGRGHVPGAGRGKDFAMMGYDADPVSGGANEGDTDTEGEGGNGVGNIAGYSGRIRNPNIPNLGMYGYGPEFDYWLYPGMPAYDSALQYYETMGYNEGADDYGRWYSSAQGTQSGMFNPTPSSMYGINGWIG